MLNFLLIRNLISNEIFKCQATLILKIVYIFKSIVSFIKEVLDLASVAIDEDDFGELVKEEMLACKTDLSRIQVCTLCCIYNDFWYTFNCNCTSCYSKIEIFQLTLRDVTIA